MNIEFDIKEILLDIKQSIDKVNTKVDRLTEDTSYLKTEIVRVEQSLKADIRVLDEKITRVEQNLKSEIKVLDEKIDGIGKRVDTQEFINRGVIVGLLLTILGGFAKLVGFTAK